MRYLAVLLVLSTFLFSCKKKYHMVGRVFNPITGEGIANAKVKFSRTTFDAIPGGDEEVANTLTDSNGNYDLEFKGRAEVVKLDASLYELGTLKEGVYQQALQLEAKKTMEVNWHAVQYGNYSLEVNNVNCGGGGDTIIINQQNQVESLLNIDWTLVGCSGYTTTMQKTPMGWRYIYWTVIRGGVSSSFSDQIFIGAGQDIVYVLDY